MSQYPVFHMGTYATDLQFPEIIIVLLKAATKKPHENIWDFFIWLVGLVFLIRRQTRTLERLPTFFHKK